MIWNELGVNVGTALIVLCALYFAVKWAVRSGVREGHGRMNGEKGWLRGACERVLLEEPGTAKG